MSIRTTVTLDEVVLERLKLESRKRGIPFRQALNDVLRLGLVAGSPSLPRRLRIRPKNMGLRPGLTYDNGATLLAIAEGETHS